MIYEETKKIPEEKRFFVNRIRRWILNPENDKVLTDEIKAGKYPGLEILLKEQDGE